MPPGRGLFNNFWHPGRYKVIQLGVSGEPPGADGQRPASLSAAAACGRSGRSGPGRRPGSANGPGDGLGRDAVGWAAAAARDRASAQPEPANGLGFGPLSDVRASDHRAGPGPWESVAAAAVTVTAYSDSESQADPRPGPGPAPGRPGYSVTGTVDRAGPGGPGGTTRITRAGGSPRPGRPGQGARAATAARPGGSVTVSHRQSRDSVTLGLAPGPAAGLQAVIPSSGS